MPHYIFKPYPLGNASQKLVVFIEGQRAPLASWCSFDGRFHPNGSMRTFDDPRYWNAANGLHHLKTVFNGSDRQVRINYENDPRLRKAYIAEANYPQSGRILAAWNLQTKRWEDPESVRVAENTQFLANKAAKNEETSYAFWLSVPMQITFGKAVTWKQFYSVKPFKGEALMDLIAQFDWWKTIYVNARPQSSAQIYGKECGKFALSDREVPRVGFLNTTTLLPYYHGTRTVIKEYAEIQAEQQAFEEMWSNIAA